MSDFADPEPGDRSPRISAPLVLALSERYEIVRETGRGASAIVYLARDLKHERLVAVKTLNPDVGSVAGERFLREIQVSAGMQHPHILPTYDSGVADGRLFFVMPFVDGGSLRDRLDAEPQLPVAEALQCAHDIALALAFAHDQGVVHRDIKPENILFYHGHACLADFGVARVMQEIDVRVTGHGMVVGTPAYMSPEQLTDGGFDGRSDVYSLACVLYEMLAGVHAFSGSTPRELLQKRLRVPPEPIDKHRADVPQLVEELLVRALAASPDARFIDARAFADAIEIAQRDLATPTRTSAPRRAIASVPRHPLAWAGSAALLVAFLALAATPLRTIVRSHASTALAATASPTDAFSAGKTALDKWDLPAAEQAFAHAAAADPAMATAQLALAHTLEYQRRVDSDPFRLAAARLKPLRGSLHGRDSLLADAMIALAAHAYPRACDAFNAMRAADSLDAAAWYGIGDCLSLDSMVVADPASPSKLRFRAGWHSAANAYMRAVTIDPLAHRALSYAVLSGILPATGAQVRFGYSEKGAAPEYAAHASMDGDTVAFVPYPIGALASPTASVLSTTSVRALARNRDLLVAFGKQWTAADSANADAFEALATGYESRGELDGGGAGGALQRARALGQPAQRVRLAAAEVRVRLKRGEFETARAIVDSLLASRDTALTVGDADRLAGLAALTGRVDLAARLGARSASSFNASTGIPPQVTAVSQRLFARAAAGVCDSVLALRDSVNRLLESYAEPTRRNETRQTLLARPMALGYPCTGGAGLAGVSSVTPLDRAQRAHAAGNGRGALAILDSLDAVRGSLRPGDVALDFTVQEAALRAALGDSARAVRQLDLVLNALPTLGFWSVREPAQSAAVGRALLLRAELADRAKDVEQRRRRASQALALWQHADPSLTPTLDRLRVLASTR